LATAKSISPRSSDIPAAHEHPESAVAGGRRVTCLIGLKDEVPAIEDGDGDEVHQPDCGGQHGHEAEEAHRPL
jgi:hypothetical protein